MLEETTLRFCSSRDTDRVSRSRPPRLPSTTRWSSGASGLREQPSIFLPSGAPLIELCCRGMHKELSQCTRTRPCTEISNDVDVELGREG